MSESSNQQEFHPPKRKGVREGRRLYNISNFKLCQIKVIYKRVNLTPKGKRMISGGKKGFLFSFFFFLQEKTV